MAEPKRKRFASMIDYLDSIHAIDQTKAFNFSKSFLGKLPADVLLKMLTDYVDVSLKDITRCCRISKEFKKKYCDTGVVYDRLFSRQYGEKFKHAKKLLEPYNISPLNRLLAYRFANLPPLTFDSSYRVYYLETITISSTEDIEISFDTNNNEMSIDFTEDLPRAGKSEKLYEKIKTLTRYFKGNIKFYFDQDDEEYINYAIGNMDFILKHYSDIFDVLFIIYANIFEMFGVYAGPYGPNVKENNQAAFLGCNLCGSQEISGTCGDCQQVNYCGRGCQEKDFTKHQKECSKN
jgi:hypothetical protein